MNRLLENIHKITATTDTTPITKGSANGVYTSCCFIVHSPLAHQSYEEFL